MGVLKFDRRRKAAHKQTKKHRANGETSEKRMPASLANAALRAVGAYLSHRGLPYHLDQNPSEGAPAYNPSSIALTAPLGEVGLLSIVRDRHLDNMPPEAQTAQPAGDVAGGDFADGAHPFIASLFEGSAPDGRLIEGAFLTSLAIDYRGDDALPDAERIAAYRRAIESEDFAERFLRHNFVAALEAYEASYNEEDFVLIRRWHHEAAARLGLDSLVWPEGEPVLVVEL